MWWRTWSGVGRDNRHIPIYTMRAGPVAYDRYACTAPGPGTCSVYRRARSTSVSTSTLRGYAWHERCVHALAPDRISQATSVEDVDMRNTYRRVASMSCLVVLASIPV